MTIDALIDMLAESAEAQGLTMFQTDDHAITIYADFCAGAVTWEMGGEAVSVEQVRTVLQARRDAVHRAYN
jgi:phage host-nuclease inhibitor protein Gam